MKIRFNKYEGAGNDFIVVRNTPVIIEYSDMLLISRLCNRRFGIGADGLILIEDCPGFDFRMVYFNTDGSRGAMCGNGARCASHFVMRHFSGFRDLTFIADDGPHSAFSIDHDIIEISVGNVSNIRKTPDGYLLNTGVPHLVVFTGDTEIEDFVSFARPLRHSPRYGPEGVNVNLVEAAGNTLRVRTFERGVEDETFACGTGVTASAIAAAFSGKIVTDHPEVTVRGGTLAVRFRLTPEGAEEIFLKGPAILVFSGEIEL